MLESLLPVQKIIKTTKVFGVGIFLSLKQPPGSANAIFPFKLLNDMFKLAAAHMKD